MLSAAKVVLTCGAIDERVWSCKLSQCSHRTMSKRPILRGAWLGLDLIIPIGALLVICFSVGPTISPRVRRLMYSKRIRRPDRSLPQASRLPASRRGAGRASRSPGSAAGQHPRPPMPCLLQSISVAHEGPILIESHVPGQELVQAEIVAPTCLRNGQQSVPHGGNDREPLPDAAALEPRGRQLGLDDALAICTNDVEHRRSFGMPGQLWPSQRRSVVRYCGRATELPGENFLIKLNAAHRVLDVDAHCSA